ncbi:hypothetical protein BD311DRAFT_775210 [Dichomitus squalens]|uniref:Protein-S-isoprenylcysteine O-methyltransferase n=1 Tax=Dichomitus squalens TaxID=114155 RepID=A0A4Q9N1K1_9APHY|nr:hypothetical protein BD311DRAFT_775210 [Dichomitus squalens]
MSIVFLAKVLALALAMVAEAVTWKAPNPTPPTEAELSRYRGGRDMGTLYAPWYHLPVLVVSFSAHLCEIAAVLAKVYPSPPADRVLSVLFDDPRAAGKLAITPAFVIGFVLLVVGGAVRKICYDTMGKQYTFQLAVLKDHKLVTSGPYAVVRHPGYSSFLSAVLGNIMIQFLPGSYLYESGVLRKPMVAVAVAFWTAWVLGTAVILGIERVKREDATMKREFGKEWEEWAKVTPYKLIPYVW